MKSFKEFINEIAIQFGGKAYPKFNNVVIIGGGAGSGKGFVLDNLLSIEGKTFDVDNIKKLSIASTVFATKVKDETGKDLKQLDLRKPEDVSLAHEILGGLYKVDKKVFNTAIRSVLTANPDRKPNLIFDVTLKDMAKLSSISESLDRMGYAKENIHIVWVMNKFDVAVEQNQQRSRIVPDEIMFATHEGAALTFAKILSSGDKLKKYMDGDIYIAFNQATLKDENGDVIRKGDTDYVTNKSGGAYIKKANYIQVKKKGKPQTNMKQLGKDIVDKIKSYVPNTITWGK